MHFFLQNHEISENMLQIHTYFEKLAPLNSHVFLQSTEKSSSINQSFQSPSAILGEA